MDDNVLIHYGTKRHSGRYPWGSGDNPYQHESWFLNRVKQLKSTGMSDTEIVKVLGKDGLDINSVGQLRIKKSIESKRLRAQKSETAYKLKEKGYSNVEIGKMMGINESSVRSLLDPHLKVRNEILDSTAKMLKENVDSKGFIDVGAGVEHQLGVSRQRLKTAVAVLKEEGYKVYYLSIPQINNPQNKTSVMVLCPPGTEYKDVSQNRDKIHLIKEFTNDGGLTWLNIEKPTSVDSSRVKINYAEDGGKDKDGLIEIRRGLEDLSLGQSRYAQVRIAVDDTHFLKGMAVYSDSLPEGVDILFNTNKHKGTPMLGEKDNSVLKPMKDDPDNPFGSTIKRQQYYVDSNGEKKLSPINIVSEEGTWADWTNRFSSQFLSKQDTTFAKKQLDIAYKDKLQELEEIESLTNPSVKKRLLYSFADDCDSAAVDLYGAALPRTANHVILPFTNIKDNEIYAPNYKDGERVVLIRHPHAGTFEIPELVVNNKNKSAKKIIGNAKDAVGINSKVAEKLSGADFDGDTVIVIPNNKGKVKTSPSLKGLENFDPKEAYPAYEGMPKMSKKLKETEMGKISNLITDMTLRDAPPEDIVRAVKHSMVVIDAEKHNLNYKQSFEDNGIAALKEKYQGGKTKGASTLISLAGSELRVPERKESYKRDPETGKKLYEETGSYYEKNGKKVYRTSNTTPMAEVEDAYELSSGTVMENVYADHANKLKGMANKARKEAYSTKPLEYSPSAAKTYKDEVETIDAKLRTAESNSPYERRALILARQTIAAKKEANPDMTKDELKKTSAQAMAAARTKVGAKKEPIGSANNPLTEKEWEAIQSGAITPTKLDKVLNNANLDVIKKYATPRTSKAMTPAKIARAKSMLAAGYTQAEVAEALGVSVTTLRNNV